MARASGANAASTARHAGRGLGTLLALASVAVLILTSSAILASRGAATARVIGGAGSPTPAEIVTGVVTTQPPQSPVAEPSVPIDPPPNHGLPAPACPTAPSYPPLAKVVHHGPQTAKVVALTFDDGWNGPNVLKILSILQHAKVNATFFPTGQAIKHETAAWKVVASAGFPIANHTYDHRELTGLCWDQQLAELTRQEAVVAQELGIAVQPYMRPPYGDRDSVTQFAAALNGEQAVVVWDIDTRDWQGLSASGILVRALAGTNGSIILMHTLMPNTASALPSIIAHFKRRGFTFVTVGQMLGIDGPVPFQ
ncbi:MAG TPA: polysaccharide deacetylase family protein [Candidatus Dormibacteraeota bacterium]|nr:polysaccharide deacetylase family protein [Candidatus Dormibacteraeota bacterium]